MESVELVGKSLEEIRARAAEQLGVAEDRVAVEVLEEKRGGFLGLLGGVELRARATVKAEGGHPVPVVAEPVAPELTPEPETPDTMPTPEEPPSASMDDELARLANRAEQVANTVLGLMQVDVTAHAREIGDEEVRIELAGNDIALVIGKHGDTLDALQLLVAIIANRGVEANARVVLDAEEYRDRRRRSLEATAHDYAQKAVKTGREVVIRDLKPYERRIIHLVLRDDPSVGTYSEGEGRHRNLVVSPVLRPERDGSVDDALTEDAADA